MVDSSGPDALVARRQLVAILRVVVEPPDRVVYGDIVDPDTGDKAAFAGVDGLAPALLTWVARVLGRAPEGPPGPQASDRRGGSKDG